VLVADCQKNKVLGAAGIIVANPEGLKVFNDLDNPKKTRITDGALPKTTDGLNLLDFFLKSSEETESSEAPYRKLKCDKYSTAEIATWALHPSLRDRDTKNNFNPNIISAALNHGIIDLAQQIDAGALSAMLDKKLLEILKTKYGVPFRPILGVNKVEHLGSPESYPVYFQVSPRVDDPPISKPQHSKYILSVRFGPKLPENQKYSNLGFLHPFLPQ